MTHKPTTDAKRRGTSREGHADKGGGSSGQAQSPVQAQSTPELAGSDADTDSNTSFDPDEGSDRSSNDANGNKGHSLEIPAGDIAYDGQTSARSEESAAGPMSHRHVGTDGVPEDNEKGTSDAQNTGERNHGASRVGFAAPDENTAVVQETVNQGPLPAQSGPWTDSQQKVHRNEEEIRNNSNDLLVENI